MSEQKTLKIGLAILWSVMIVPVSNIAQGSAVGTADLVVVNRSNTSLAGRGEEVMFMMTVLNKFQDSMRH
jgi:hypothetical protein